MAKTSPQKVFSVPPDAAGVRLDQWLAAQLPEVSRVRVQQLIEQKKIVLNGSVPKSSLRLRGGEEIVITGAVELPPLKAFAEDIPLDVVYEDESIAVINKPAGMSVHAGSGKDEAGNRGTMVNALLHRFKQLSELGGGLRPGIVHRLDKETSGLVVVAKTDLAHRKLAEQFSRREVKKTYIALVHGLMKQTKGTINAPISRDLIRRARMTTRRGLNRKPGREAITHWAVKEQIEGPHGKFSLLEVKIETGRTHQIRVHLASIGHPVAGDTLYGAPPPHRAQNRRALPSQIAQRRRDPGALALGTPAPRQESYVGTGSRVASLERNFLHAFELQFQHPISNRPLSFQQPLPAELTNFLRQIGD
ncbi:MAG TPA: RluA family pseudouridine synthase [Candidatus Angelobacter sp.]|nr:RluA family pseudouridine synthase [Candidatus Angelobacter sp.]